uniref:RNA-dependent RNA polymerase n=1 Tax=Rabbit picobirnavirus 4 TaxID=2716678 RepID=A0A6G7PS70_9VIRU|nr:RNA-dependent RNA polymerase [Rabbit picobirnavirus 4]
MKTKPSLVEYFELPNPGLRAYFKHTTDGNDADYRPPFWKGESRDVVLAKWQRVVDADGLKRKLPALYQFEMDMKDKVGPMSIQLPLVERLDDVENYFTMVELPSEPLPESALDATCRFFSRAKGIRLRSKERTLANMRLSTNSGNPWFTKRKDVADQMLQSHVYLDGNTWMVLTPNGTYKLAAVLGWRGQEGGISDDDVKQRVIWMMSAALNLQELQFYQPAIEAMQKNMLIPAYVSMDTVDDEVTALFKSKGTKDVVVETDFTKFDQHFNQDMQNAAQYIETFLGSNEDEGISAFMNIYRAKFEIPIICNESTMFVGPHGMGSGSGGTNFDECMAHKALQYEAAIRNKQQLNPHSMAYGDDGILTYPDISVDAVIDTYSRHGQEMNATKQHVSTHDCVFLRRWHGTEYVIKGRMVGVYSTFRALGRLLAQERYYDPDKWSGEMVTLRALSILENCKWSPLFHKFIDFVMTGDKYRLGLDLPGFFEHLELKAQYAIEEFQDFLGYTKNMQQEGRKFVGINDWDVVKYLRSLK